MLARKTKVRMRMPSVTILVGVLAYTATVQSADMDAPARFKLSPFPTSKGALTIWASMFTDNVCSFPPWGTIPSNSSTSSTVNG